MKHMRVMPWRRGLLPICASIAFTAIVMTSCATGLGNTAGAQSASGQAITSPQSSYSTPISPADNDEGAFAKPKITKVEEPRGAGIRKFYDVEVKDPSITGGLEKDPAASPVRIVTYDNNSVQKDYNMIFSTAWGRVIEAMSNFPLQLVDRSSGIIATRWLAGAADSRYRYTITMRDRGLMTTIKVIPFLEVFKDGRWKTSQPSVSLTEKMFLRVHQELDHALPDER